MTCLICNDLTRVLVSAETHFHDARAASFYLVSTELAAKMQVDMERAKTALAEHQEGCDHPSCRGLGGMGVKSPRKEQ